MSFHFPTITGSRWGWSCLGQPRPWPNGCGTFRWTCTASETNTAPAPTPRYSTGAPSLDHIFQELYAVPEQIKLPYFRIKTLELLLYLDALELPAESEKPYFYKTQVEKMKAIHRLLTGDLERHYTITELSRRFSIPTTALKECFKSVYGQPINTYMRCLRMDRAALLLRQEPHAGVAEIAGRVGYDSASKFAAAFKAVKGKTPLEYRREGQ